MKKLVALMLTIALCAGLVAIPAAMAEDTIKIVMMVDTTVVDQNNGRDAFEARWEELHPGFDLEIIQPDHSARQQRHYPASGICVQSPQYRCPEHHTPRCR